LLEMCDLLVGFANLCAVRTQDKKNKYRNLILKIIYVFITLKTVKSPKSDRRWL